jgi:hypothetical protein
LTLSERLRLNHPHNIIRKWKTFIRPEPRDGTEPKPTLRDSVANLSEELHRAREHIAELEAARVQVPADGQLFDPDRDEPAMIARVIVARLGISKARAVHHSLGQEMRRNPSPNRERRSGAFKF